MNIFITGLPGSGKSTLIEKVVKELKRKGFKVGGVLTPEMRNKGERVGFKIVSTDGWEGVLASVDAIGPRFGKYKINLADLEKAVDKIEEFLKTKDIVVIDEIGKMEFFSSRFRRVVDRAISSSKVFIGVLHRSFVDEFKSKGKLFELRRDNFDETYEEVLKLVI